MCVQCCVHCMFTVCSMSASTRNLILQETIPETQPIPCSPDTQHTLTLRTDLAYSLHTYPFAQAREAWSRAVSGCVGCECGLRAENKKKCFSETYPEQSALSAKVAKTNLQRRNSKYSLLRFPRLPSQTSYFRNKLTVNVH